MGTWIARWLRWWSRQREQSGPLMQSKQNMLHSDLCEWACDLHWTKKVWPSRGFSHCGQLFCCSRVVSAPYIIIIWNEKWNTKIEMENESYHDWLWSIGGFRRWTRRWKWCWKRGEVDSYTLMISLCFFFFFYLNQNEYYIKFK